MDTPEEPTTPKAAAQPDWSELKASPAAAPPPARTNWALWLLTALGLLAGVAAGLWMLQHRAPAEAPVAVGPQAPVAPVAPNDSPAEQALAESRLPLLDKSEPLAKQLAAGISSSEAFAEFFAAPDLIRRLVALVGMAADGERAPSLLAGLSVKGEFEVREQGGRQFIAASSYERYNPLAQAIAGLDTPKLAQAYVTLRPAFGLAWRAIGRPGRTFEQALDKGLTHLLATPVPPGEVEVVSKGAVYAYADPALEALSDAQKQLVRLGPKNAEAVKSKLTEIARALSLPSAAR